MLITEVQSWGQSQRHTLLNTYIKALVYIMRGGVHACCDYWTHTQVHICLMVFSNWWWRRDFKGSVVCLPAWASTHALSFDTSGRRDVKLANVPLPLLFLTATAHSNLHCIQRGYKRGSWMVLTSQPGPQQSRRAFWTVKMNVWMLIKTTFKNGHKANDQIDVGWTMLAGPHFIHH